MTKNMTAAQHDAAQCQITVRDQRVAVALVLVFISLSIGVQGLVLWQWYHT